MIEVRGLMVGRKRVAKKREGSVVRELDLSFKCINKLFNSLFKYIDEILDRKNCALVSSVDRWGVVPVRRHSKRENRKIHVPCAHRRRRRRHPLPFVQNLRRVQKREGKELLG